MAKWPASPIKQIDPGLFPGFLWLRHQNAASHFECRFFDRLLHEKTNYELVHRFDYHVPPYLPDVKTDFANFEVLLFERREETAQQVVEKSWENPTNAQLGQNIILQG